MAKSSEEVKARKRAYMVTWRLAYPDYMREWAHTAYKNKGDRYKAYARKGALKSKYALSIEDYDNKLKEQNGVCALCQQPPQKYRLAVDHSHITNETRSLLCTPCNVKLAVFEDSSFRFKAENYLRKWGGK